MLGCSVMSDSLWPHGLSPPGSSVCGIFQARILEWVAISSLRGSSWPGIKAASRVAPAWSGRFLTIEPPGKPIFKGYLLLYSRNLKGKCQGKDGDIYSRPFLSYLGSKEKFLCVFPTGHHPLWNQPMTHAMEEGVLFRHIFFPGV